MGVVIGQVGGLGRLRGFRVYGALFLLTLAGSCRGPLVGLAPGPLVFWSFGLVLWCPGPPWSLVPGPAGLQPLPISLLALPLALPRVARVAGHRLRPGKSWGRA